MATRLLVHTIVTYCSELIRNQSCLSVKMPRAGRRGQDRKFLGCILRFIKAIFLAFKKQYRTLKRNLK